MVSNAVSLISITTKCREKPDGCMVNIAHKKSQNEGHSDEVYLFKKV